MTSTALLIMDVQQGIVDRFAGRDIPGAVAPTTGEPVVTKRRVSAFAGHAAAATPPPAPGHAAADLYSQSLRLNTQ